MNEKNTAVGRSKLSGSRISVKKGTSRGQILICLWESFLAGSPSWQLVSGDDGAGR